MYYIFWIVLFCYIFLFLISLKLKDNSIVDIFWWFWFIIISFWEYFYYAKNSLFHILVLVLILLWWCRIIYSILSRKLKHKWEDPRYSSWRKQWKYFKTRSFFQIYILQMILLFMVSLPLYFIFTWEVNTILFFIWSIVSLFWLIYETIADHQLSNYIKFSKQKNLIFTKWLFNYSRHPNYFWEICFWLWITIISFSNWYYWLIGFIVITCLLLFVSWVPMKEKRYKLKDNYKEYSSETSLIIPNFFK